MGAMKQQKISKRKARRAKVKEAQVKVSWSDVNATRILDLIYASEKFDGAVRFGRTRDGGTFALGLYDGPENWTEYHTGVEGVDAWIGDIFEDIVLPE